MSGSGAEACTGLAFCAFAQVVLIDITLASDNAIAIGMAAAGLPPQQRRQAIVLGLGAAVVLLCGLAFFAVRLLQIGGPGLVLAGGLLLLLICWQLWKDLRARARGEDRTTTRRKRKTLRGALTQIFIADISTSLDNVLAVAGVVRPTALGAVRGAWPFGAADRLCRLVAKLLQRPLDQLHRPGMCCSSPGTWSGTAWSTGAC